MSKSVWIANLLILGAVLEADLGRKGVGWWRIVRPLIAAAVVVPLFVKSPQGSGNGLALELGLAGLGLVLGVLVSVGLMKVGTDASTGRLTSWAGFPYGAAWVLIIGARLLFTYGSNHWYAHELGRWLQTNQITSDALTDGLILMAIVMTLTRTGRLALSLRTTDRVMEAPAPQAAAVAYPDGQARSAGGLLSRGPIHRLPRARQLGSAPVVHRQRRTGTSV
jgi:hypothetical protein